MGETTGVPARDRALEGIRWHIRSHGLVGGDRLPSERELAEECNVSRTALRGAITQLIAMNELEARPGSGTYLRASKPLNILEGTFNYSESVERVGRVPGARVVRAQLMPADEKAARGLELGPGAPVFLLERVRTADDEPVSLERVYLSVERFPGLDGRDFSDASLYDVLYQEYGMKIRHGEERISVTRARADEAELLEVPEGMPVFFQEAVERDENRVPLEYSRHVIRSDRYRFASNGLPSPVREEVGDAWLRS